MGYKMSRKRSFPKTLFKQEEFENAGFSFSVDGKYFENGAVRTRRQDDHVISLHEYSSHTNPKMTGDCCDFNFSGIVWKVNIWCIFKVNSSGAQVSVFKGHYRGDFPALIKQLLKGEQITITFFDYHKNWKRQSDVLNLTSQLCTGVSNSNTSVAHLYIRFHQWK